MVYGVNWLKPLTILYLLVISVGLRVACATKELSAVFMILIDVTAAPPVVQLTLTALSEISLMVGTFNMLGKAGVLTSPR